MSKKRVHFVLQNISQASCLRFYEIKSVLVMFFTKWKTTVFFLLEKNNTSFFFHFVKKQNRVFVFYSVLFFTKWKTPTPTLTLTLISSFFLCFVFYFIKNTKKDTKSDNWLFWMGLYLLYPKDEIKKEHRGQYDQRNKCFPYFVKSITSKY